MFNWKIEQYIEIESYQIRYYVEMLLIEFVYCYAWFAKHDCSAIAMTIINKFSTLRIGKQCYTVPDVYSRVF